MRFVVVIAVFLAAVAIAAVTAVAAIPAAVAVAVLFCLVQKETCGLPYAFAPRYFTLYNVSPVPVRSLFRFLS